MSMFLKPRKDGESVDVYVGKGINGKKFNGDKMRKADGTKTYNHLNLKREGGDYVSKGKSSLFRPAGVPGKLK